RHGLGRAFLLCVLIPLISHAADTPAPYPNSAFIDEQGRTHVTLVVPVPVTLSPEGQAKLSKPPPSILSSGASVAEQRMRMDARQQRDAAACIQIYPAKWVESAIAGVTVRIVDPVAPAPDQEERVLINLHGGAFRVDAGSLLESIPIASLTRTRVVSVLYRMAPEHPFPAAVDDAVAVYRELLKTHSAKNLVLYGTSAGAILTAETAVRLKQLGLPLPAALGLFSGMADFTKSGDSAALFTLQGLTGSLLFRGPGPLMPEYVGQTAANDPVLSPVFADLRGMPPTLFLTSTRDLLLSGTVILHRSFLRAGVDARLAVWEALPHAFWLDSALPESHEANQMIARFFAEHLGK
ncbi:MAG: alpha/beta hydrolase fold domain-containing protein, partial [Opitutales bacterium]